MSLPSGAARVKSYNDGMKRLRAAAPGLVLGALVVLAWGALLSASRLFDLRAAGPVSDSTDVYFPLFHYFGAALKAGVFPLWCPLIFGGFPFLAGQTAPFYPPNLLAAALLPPVAGYNWALFSGYACAALTLRAYARRTGLDPWAASFGGFVFCAFGFFVGHLPEQNLIKAAAWLPLALFAAADLNEGRWRRGVALAAAAWGLQFLAAAPQMAYYSGLAFLLALAAGRRAKGVSRAKVALAAGAAAVLALGLGAVFLLPAREAAAFSYYGGADQLRSARGLMLHARDLARLFDRGAVPYFPEGESFVGLTAFLLAAGGALWSWARPRARPAAVPAALFVFAWAGASFLMGACWRFLPGFSLFRFPVRLLALSHCAVALSAAAGLHALRARSAKLHRRGPALATALVFLAAGAESMSYIAARAAPVDPAGRFAAPETVARVRAALGGGRLYSFVPSDLGLGLHRPGAGDRGLGRQLVPNTNALEGIASISGVAALETMDALTLQSAMATYQGDYRPDKLRWTPDARWTRALALQGASVVASFREVAAPGLKSLGAAADPRDGRALNLYAVERPLPDARLVHAAKLFPEPWRLIRYALSGEFRPEREALLTAPPGPLSAARGPESVKLLEDGPNAARWAVSVTAPGLFVLNRSFHPAWRARVDGRGAAVLKADYAFMAVPVPAGAREVTLSFRPFASVFAVRQ